MTRQQFKLWSHYQANSKRVSQALDFTLRAGKDAIRKRDDSLLFTLQRLSLLLLAAHTESRLNETIWFYAHVQDADRARIGEKSIEDSWLDLIDLGFANQRDIPMAKVPARLSYTDGARRTKLVQITKDHIAPLVSARNALAHGGWEVAMTPNGDGVDGARTATIKKYTLFRIINERNLINHFTWIIHDLVITKYAYDRDFDRKIADVDAARGRVTRGREQSWEKMLQDRHDRRPKRTVK